MSERELDKQNLREVFRDVASRKLTPQDLGKAYSEYFNKWRNFGEISVSKYEDLLTPLNK
jgi:hypothetical protein